MTDNDDVQRPDPGLPPRTALVLGALVSPTFVAMMTFAIWTSTRNLEGSFWFAAVLIGIMLGATVLHMFATKWRLDRVAFFVTAAGTAMGLGWAGMTLFHDTWWAMGAFGLLFLTTLVSLITDLEDHTKLWGLMVAMFVPAGIVAGMFMYIFDAAGIG